MNRLNLIYYPTTQNATFSSTCVDSSFTGKERDEETGYSYFGSRYYDADLLTGWMSVDPMADKYPSLSPYNYCAWNPVKLKDPNGSEIADFYNLKGEWIGTDGIDDNRFFLVTSDLDVSLILSNGENCNIQTTQISDVHSAIELPSIEIREVMLTTLIEQDALDPYREYGGLVLGETNSVIGWAKPGAEFQFNGEATIKPYVMQDPSILNREDCAVKWRFHSHPSGTRWCGDKYSCITQMPDEFDTENMKSRPTTSGVAFKFGMRSQMVNIYNEHGTLVAIPFELFKNIGR